MKTIIPLLLSILSFTPAAFAQQKDDPKCKDHPLFTRMPDSWIHNCQQRAFDAFAFKVGKGKSERVEGQLWKIVYYPLAALKSRPSELQILRNFENAVKRLGGTVLFQENIRETFRITKDGKEVWLEVWAEFTGTYGFTIVQKEAMAHDIVANAEALFNDINATGHVAVYGILFDTGKSDLKPESEQAIGESAELLKNDGSLNVYVFGHTDNAGGLESNMKLSQSRADAVVKALVCIHSIPAARLKAFGAGPYAPAASNDTEEGKAKNCRVELVKQ